MYAIAQATLGDETIKLTGFSSSDKRFAFIRRFSDLEGVPHFHTQQMSIFLKTSIHEGSELVYLDDILLMSISKPHILQLIKQLLDLARKEVSN